MPVRRRRKAAKALNRNDGIDAIIKLQGLAGVTESRKTAGAGWDKMSDEDKELTMDTLARFTKN